MNAEKVVAMVHYSNSLATATAAVAAVAALGFLAAQMPPPKGRMQ